MGSPTSRRPNPFFSPKAAERTTKKARSDRLTDLYRKRAVVHADLREAGIDPKGSKIFTDDAASRKIKAKEKFALDELRSINAEINELKGK